MQTIVNKLVNYSLANKDGFTLNLNTFQPVESGYIVACKETQNQFNKEGLKTCLKHAVKNNLCLGGWFDKESQKYYYDAVYIFKDLQTAINMGVLNDQIAIFDLYNMQEIRLK